MRVLIADRNTANPYSLGLAHGLQTHGARVIVAGPTNTPEAGVSKIYPRSGVRDERLAKLYEAMAGVARFASLMRGGHPDIVHLLWATPYDEILAWTARRFGARIAFTLHNPTGRRDKSQPHMASQARLVGLAELVLIHGPAMNEVGRRNYPECVHKMHVIEHGNYEHVIHRYDRSESRRRLGLPEHGVVFAFVGGIERRKGVSSLLRAYCSYRASGGRGSLVITGTEHDPEYVAELRNLAATASGVVWRTSPSSLDHDLLDLSASAASAVVLPFEDASQSGTVILGMTHGRCVMASALGEIPRVLQSRGRLLSPGDDAELAQALHWAEKNEETCDVLGRRARQFALVALSWEKIGGRVYDLYEAVLAC